MLTRISYPSVAGINGVAWDVVELPSQFMENYAWLPEVLARMSARERRAAPEASSAATLPAASGRLPRSAGWSSRLRHAHARGTTRSAAGALPLLTEVRAAVAVTPVPSGTLPAQPRIFAGGYAAATYKWAEVLAADAFAAFKDEPIGPRRSAF
jgi:oligopeptidase A